MVNIASKDLNKDIGSYIGKRRAKTRGPIFGFKGLKKKTVKIEAAPAAQEMGMEVEYKKPGMFSKLFSFRRGMVNEAEQSEDLSPQEMARLKGMEDDIEETEEKIAQKEAAVKEIRQEEKIIVERRENLLGKFFGKIKSFKRRPMADVSSEPAYPVEDEPVLDQEVIDVIKIAHRWLNELPPGKKRSFKASTDFQKYKAMLLKYGLVKEKSEEKKE